MASQSHITTRWKQRFPKCPFPCWKIFKKGSSKKEQPKALSQSNGDKHTQARPSPTSPCLTTRNADRAVPCWKTSSSDSYWTSWMGHEKNLPFAEANLFALQLQKVSPNCMPALVKWRTQIRQKTQTERRPPSLAACFRCPRCPASICSLHQDLQALI